MSAVSDPRKEAESYLYWSGDVAYLPGSSLSFTRGSDGELQLQNIDEDLLRNRQKLIKDSIFNESILLCRYCLRAMPKNDMYKNETFCRNCARLDHTELKIAKNLSQHDDLLVQRKLKNQKKVEDANNLNWTEWVRKNGMTPVPHYAFNQEQRSSVRNLFMVGQKLEGINPFTPSKFFVLTVVDVVGHRIRLHMDSYDDKHDFYTTSNNSLIFPVGFCQSTGRKLEPLLDRKSFNWDDYLKETNSQAAPKEAFSYTSHHKDRDGCAKAFGFKIGLKLEASDKATDSEICVATIKDIINHKLLISYDGWEDSFDCWVSFYSTLIYPINWCERNGVTLMLPKGYPNRAFTWSKYLKHTNSKAVPSVSFKRAQKKWPRIAFEKGMMLEAVDCRNLKITRIATIEKVLYQYILICYEGWHRKYNTRIHVDAPEMFPIATSSRTKHPFEPPPYMLDEARIKANTKCPTKNCSGMGHTEWYKYDRHDDIKDCQYADENYLQFSDLGSENLETNNEKLNNNQMDQSDDVILLESDSSCETSTHSNPARKIKSVANSQDKSLLRDESDKTASFLSSTRKHLKSNYKRLKNKVDFFDDTMMKETKSFVEKLNIDLFEFLHDDCTKIESLITKFTNNTKFASNFRQQNIDGMALLLLTEEEIEHLNDSNSRNLPLALKTECLIYFLMKPLYEDQ